MTRILLLAAILVCAAPAQPPVIRLIRGTIPNPQMQPYAASGGSVNVVGMYAVAGPFEGWLAEFHDSFGSLENLDKALGYQLPAGAPGPNARALVGSYRAGFSYRAEQAMQSLAKARYVDVVIYHIQPGERGDFERFLKTRRAAMSSVNLDRPTLVYQVASGEPLGTFLVLAPLPSLRIFDDVKPSSPVYEQGEQAAEKKAAVATDFQGEHVWLRIDPGMSHVSDDFASADTDFWRAGAR
jgi:hypothetical protein